MEQTNIVERKIYLDVLRALACIMIVGVHVSAQRICEVEITSASFRFMNASDCFCIIGVPLFVMISGALMLDEKREITIRKLLTKYVPRLVVAYLSWLTLYNVIDYIKLGHWFTWRSFKDEVIWDVIMGSGMYHMWFMPMIIGLYLLLPLLRPMVRTKQACEYFLLFYFVWTLVFTTLFVFPHGFENPLTTARNITQIKLFEGYIGYFILGHYLNQFQHEMKKWMKWSLIGIGAVSFLIEIMVCYRDSLLHGELSTVLNNPLTLNVFFSAIAIFLFVQDLSGKMREGSRFYKICKSIGRYSFGIYLSHPLLLNCLLKHEIYTTNWPVWFSIPLMTFGVVGAMWILTWILSKIPILKDWVI